MGLESAQITQQPAARQRRPRIPATSSVWNPLAGDRWWPTTEPELARYYLPTLSYDDDWSDEWVRLACERGVLSPQHEQDVSGSAPLSTRRRRWPLARTYSDASRSADGSESAVQVAEEDPPPYCAVDPVLPLSSSAACGSPSPPSPLHVNPNHDSTFIENLPDDLDEPEPSSVRRASSAGSTDSGYVSILSRLSRHSSRHSQATITSQEGDETQVEQPQFASLRRGRLSISIRKKKGRRTSEPTVTSQASLAV